MILFLDVVSPIPEFHLINDKKIEVSIKISEKNDEKISDTIIPKYLELNNIYKLTKKITHLIVTTGPGSYTSLRVGASFIAGLSQSLNLPISTVSSENIYEFLNNGNLKTGIFFKSSNNQKFLTYKKNLKFFHLKIENKNFNCPKNITNLFYNSEYPEFNNTPLNSISFSVVKVVLKNMINLKFEQNLIIKPIYISNNTILN